MDEAVLRIKLEGDTGARPTRDSGGAPKPPPQPPPLAPPADKPLTSVAPPPAPPRDWIKDLVDGIAGANRHVLLEGQSGSGKSSLARHVAFERMAQGEEVHVVDPGHGAAQWKGAASVFGMDTAGSDAANFMKDVLRQRKEEKEAAAKRGEQMGQEDFKPMTIVFSDFKKLLQDTPKLANELNAMLTEARKFNIAILAETTSMSGIKGVASMRENFAQQMRLYGPTATEPGRRAETNTEEFTVPNLPDYKDRFDPNIIRPPAPPSPPPPPDDRERRRAEREADRAFAERQRAQAEFDEAEAKWLKAERKMKEDALREVEEQRKLDERRARKELEARPEAEVYESPEDRAEKRRQRRQEQEDERAAYAERYGEEEAEEVYGKKRGGKKKGGVLDFLKQTAGAVGGGAGGVVGAGAGLAGLAAAGAGPAGLVTAALEVDKAVKGAVKGAISGVGDVLIGAAKTGEGAPETIGKLSSAVTKFGDMLPGIGIAFSAVGKVGEVMAGLMQEFQATAERFAQYNPEIAQALQLNELRQITNDMQRANRNGAELARFVEENGKLQQQFEEIKQKIWEKILPVLIKIMQMVGRLLGIAEAAQVQEIEDPSSILYDQRMFATLEAGGFLPEL